MRNARRRRRRRRFLHSHPGESGSFSLSFFLVQPSHPFGPSCILLPFFCPLFVDDDDNEEKKKKEKSERR